MPEIPMPTSGPLCPWCLRKPDRSDSFHWWEMSSAIYEIGSKRRCLPQQTWRGQKTPPIFCTAIPEDVAAVALDLIAETPPKMNYCDECEDCRHDPWPDLGEMHEWRCLYNKERAPDVASLLAPYRQP